MARVARVGGAAAEGRMAREAKHTQKQQTVTTVPEAVPTQIAMGAGEAAGEAAGMMEVSLVSLGLGSAQLAEEGTALLPVKAVPAALKAPTRMVGSLPTFAAYTGAVGPAEAHAVACLGRPRMSGSIDGDTMAHCIARRASAPHNPSPRPHTRKRHLPPWASSRPRSSSRAQHEAARHAAHSMLPQAAAG